MTKQVILTGLRANNDLTLGNYFGGILPMVDMAKTRSDEFQINMFIPDLHSFTTPIDHSQLYDQVIQTAKLFAAAGLPLANESIYLYRQSFVPAHSELTWILDNFTGFGQMARMTQFKEKAAKLMNDPNVLTNPEYGYKRYGEHSNNTTVGLFNYPVLMAADILLYGSSYVPVGEDQTQHIEFTRDIAERMNARFGELFVVPEPVKKQHEFFGKDQGLRVMDLVDPTKKMSKSDEFGKGVIFLSDDPEAAAKKVMSATTDDKAEVIFDRDNQPGIANLLEISHLLYSRANETSFVEHTVGMQVKFGGNYGDFKKHVAHQVKDFLIEFQAQLHTVDQSAVLAKLESSEQAMNNQANATLARVQHAVGLRRKT